MMAATHQRSGAVSRKLASGVFASEPIVHAPETVSLSLGTHQENAVFYWGVTLGCAVAPNNAGAGWGDDLTPYTGSLPLVNQENPNGCGPAAAWNALIVLEGAKAINQNNQVLFDQFSAQAQQNGTSTAQIASEFNQFAAGTGYQATVTTGDPTDLGQTATSGAFPLIGSVSTGPNEDHAVVYVPEGGQATVYSTTSNDAGVYTGTVSPSSISSGIYRSAPNGPYQIITIGF